MADLIIRGMEMPDTLACICIRPDGAVFPFNKMYKAEEWENVKAVQIPPHGRLGDLAEIEKKLQKTLDGMGDRWLSSPTLMAQRVAIVADLKKVKEVPTIIPADKDGDA